MASLNVGNVGEFLREQRRNARLSLRQLADAAGVSNPYLSQIERGLRKPSAEILQQLARALRISAETLYIQAGILDERRDRDEMQVHGAILTDPALTEHQKQVLLQIYEAFRKENAAADEGSAPKVAGVTGVREADAPQSTTDGPVTTVAAEAVSARRRGAARGSRAGGRKTAAGAAAAGRPAPDTAGAGPGTAPDIPAPATADEPDD
ncbi:helix-turn-helix domain-containing protein [Streptomyces sp. NPDC059740]|uniref:helix-turn-helix domain-containing protein n=1 Tax=Streptomyces sp. NPDC059740 TaxID=3346926 RepID=UPI00364752AE